jgi:hypothetical protein
VSYLHALLGEKEEALVALAKACDGREFLLPFVSVDPVFDNRRAEPRFQAVLRRMGLVK